MLVILMRRVLAHGRHRAKAADPPQAPADQEAIMSVPFLACMALTASFYHLPPRVLPSIQAVEGGQIGTIHPNADGTQDLGVMQVNSRWIAPIAHYVRMTEQAVALRLLNDSCFNIAAAGLILRTYLNEAHGNLMQAVGYYNSHTPTHGLVYRTKVINAALKLFVHPAVAASQ
jgi:hypothetical protein